MIAEGTAFGPYTLGPLLGKGGMGEVYRAHDRRLGRDVAVKVLPPSMASDPEALARFEREARAVAALNHPAIVALHDVGMQDGTAYVVTELLDGETLRDRLERDGALPLRRLLGLAVQVAQGLGAAHTRGIVHRDVKPENIFLLADGRVKLLDFGIARQVPPADAVNETVLVTRPGIIMGTFGYLAPEVIRGEPATPQSDIFAFGIVLYEALTGENPFRRETVAETLSAVLRDEPPPLASRVPAVPPTLARLVHWCLEPRAGDRPDSLRDLARHLDSLDTDAVAPGAPRVAPMASSEVMSISVLRRWMFGAILAGVTATTAAALLVVSWLGDPSSTTPGPAAAERVQRVVTREQDARTRMLELEARFLASYPALKDLLTGTNVTTISAFLEDQRDTAGVLVALDLEGRVLGSTDRAVLLSGAAADALAGVAPIPGGTVVVLDGRPHHAAAATADAAGRIFGRVVAAAPIDDAFARVLAEATASDVALFDLTGLRGASARAPALPWVTLDAWRESGGSPTQPQTLSVAGRQVVIREVELSTEPALSALVVQDAGGNAGATSRVHLALLAAGLLVLLAGVGGSWWLTRPASPGRQRS